LVKGNDGVIRGKLRTTKPEGGATKLAATFISIGN